MASEQARRENVTDERKIQVEKDRVPKMATHFESLAEKTKEQQDPHIVVHQFETVPVKVVGVKKDETHDHQKTSSQSHQMHAGGKQPETKGHSLEEISNLRATAQHNSAEAVRTAEERYHKAKGTDMKEDHVSSTTTGALKDTAMEKGQQAKDVIVTKGVVLKDTAMEKSQQAKDYMSHKAPEVKDVLTSKGQTAAQYAAEKAKAATQTTVDASTVAAEYVGEKAVAAKDATVESGKGAAGYAGKVASGVKDQAVVAGWGATHYTLEKAAEATKAAAGLTSSVAGYTTDKVVGAGKTVAGYAGEKLAAAKDVVVATEEKAADYAGRKQAEAKKDLEEKKLSHQQQGEGGEALGSKVQHRGGEQLEGTAMYEKSKEYFQEGEEKQQQGEGEQGGSGTGTVFQAIGETIVEIGQTTKDLLVGQHPVQLRDEAVAKENEEQYGGGI